MELKNSDGDKPPDHSTVAAPTADANGRNTNLSPVLLMATVSLTFSSGFALYTAADKSSSTFVLACYSVMLLLFLCVRAIEKAPEDSPRRGRLRAALWLLSTLAILLFSHRVASIMPLAAAVAIWSIAGLSISAGFYTLCIYPEKYELLIPEGSTTT